MATALETYLERDEVFLDQHADLEWVDDVHAYRCTRCTKVLVQHYIANCEHKFCANCRRLVDDGSRRWRCPLCNTFITDIGAQSAVFKERAVRLRLRCPNRKYGCPHICPFKDIKEHLAECEHTKERALPVLYQDGPTVEMLDRMFSAQLKNLRTEMEQRMDETEKRNALRDEWAWQLSLRANKMKRGMLRMERRQKDAEEKAAKLEDEISDLKKKSTKGNLEGVSLSVEENKSRIMNLEVKSEYSIEIMDFNNRKNIELMNQLKNEVEKQLKTKEIQTQSEMNKLEQTMNEIRLEQKKEWAETKDKVSEVIEKERKKREEMTSAVSTQILKLNQQIERLGKDLENQMVKVEETIEDTEVRLKRKLEEETSQITLTIETNQNNVLKLGRETDDRFKEVEANNTKNNELTRQNLQKEFQTKVIEVKKEMEEKWAEVDGNISVTSDEISALKKKVNETEEESMRLIYNSTIKAELQHLIRVNEYYKEEPDFTWIANAQRLLAGSEVFPLRAYPFSAQVKLTTYLSRSDILFEVRFKDTNTTNETREMKPKPNIFITLKDQSKNKERKNIVITSNAYFSNYKAKFKNNHFYHVSSIYKSLLQSPLYNVKDKVEIAIHVEAPEVAQSVYSEDGTLTWAIDDFRKKIQAEEEGLIQCQLSPYFYTSPKGRRVQVRAYLNGVSDYKNSGLSIYVDLLDGVNDEDLGSPSRYKTSVTIFHPTQPLKRINKSKEDKNIPSAYFNMGSCAEMESFLHNDTLYYKVIIENIK